MPPPITIKRQDDINLVPHLAEQVGGLVADVEHIKKDCDDLTHGLHEVEEKIDALAMTQTKQQTILDRLDRYVTAQETVAAESAKADRELWVVIKKDLWGLTVKVLAALVAAIVAALGIKFGTGL